MCGKGKQDEMLTIASLESNLYQQNMIIINGAKINSLANFYTNFHFLKIWHKKLGHLNENSAHMIQSMVRKMVVEVVQDDVHSYACEGCVESKQIMPPFPMKGGIR